VELLFSLNEAIERFRPNEIRYDASYARFDELAQKEGIHYAIIDLDGTLCAKGESEVKGTVREILQLSRRRQDLKEICIVSNLVYGNNEREMRLIKAAKQIESCCVGAYWPNLKPKASPYLRAMELMGSTPKNTVVIGDQLLTDILGGNLLGMYTILVPSLPGSDHFTTKLKRPIEKWILKQLGLKLPVLARA